MKTHLTTVALALASLTAFAQEATVFDDNVVSTRTRAEVRAEVTQAIARGERLSYGEANPDAVVPAMSQLKRADVRAQVQAAIVRGERLSFGEAGQPI
jgi:hypothetical protein